MKRRPGRLHKILPALIGAAAIAISLIVWLSLRQPPPAQTAPAQLSCIPNCGGIGTILFTIFGIVLIGAAAVLLIVLAVIKRPKDRKDEDKKNNETEEEK